LGFEVGLASAVEHLRSILVPVINQGLVSDLNDTTTFLSFDDIFQSIPQSAFAMP